MDKFERIAKRIASSKSGQIRTAGKIEFVKDTGPIRRDIRVKDFNWSPDSLRNLAKILWAAQRSHSYAMSAYRLFSKMPSADFSPDGMLGGRGYIQNVKDMRASLAAAVEAMSAFTDTVHDEVNAEHWSTAEEQAPAVQPMVEDAEAVKAHPDSFVESEYGQVGPGEFSATQEGDDEPPTMENPDADSINPQLEGDEEEEEEEEEPATFTQAASKPKKPAKVAEAKLPTDESEQKQGKTESEMTMHTTTPDHGSYAAAVAKVLRAHERRVASMRYLTSGGPSALPQGDLGGPRVEHVGPGETEEGFASDDPTGDGLSSGVNTSKPLYEDWCADGVSGYEDPISGDPSVLGIASKLASNGYSWLPGSANEKSMPYYDRGVSPQDEQWMRENNQPDMPPGIGPQKPPRSRRDEYWEAIHAE